MTFQTFANMSKTFQPFLEMQNITNSIGEQLMREGLALWSSNMGAGVNYSQTVNNKSNTPDTIMKTNLSFMADQIARQLQYTRNVLQIWEDGMNEYAQCLQQKVDATFNEYETQQHMHQKKKNNG